MRLYGLKTCDTCKKALKRLNETRNDVVFIDVRADGLAEADLDRFLSVFGGDLINRRSTTWRNLSEDDRDRDPKALLADHPTLMKRPVIDDGNDLHLGWSAEVQDRLT